ncbi:hypothetical protein Sa4125_38000 [Aureimonas sp. SA4125]|uniref:circularly permuted type 2 ATP-grasp protein n=1 Tax=Aureimonas sp. SA4125 TaxID=2826993 RepID=UPI001CC3771E|nr:circularly permuted type 2 ATP-grasp protein [Aureimonas sp. SA4125]BDA86258.1 hypothetical protein Sa4125_38000 [Aureimonas sp. SA4125]
MAAFLSAYRLQAGSQDEMLAADGSVRPHYRQLVDALATMGANDRAGRFGSAQQYLREAGVFYQVYGGAEQTGEQRGWPLTFPPVIVAQDEWAALEKALVQRAGFLEKLVGDLYGERRVIADGTLPSAILAQNPEFLRPLADQGLSGAPLIRFIAIDLGRGPQGRWWVLGDRTQAPSGAGFALENRVATSRAFPELNAELKVQRLAGFFQRFRDSLFTLNGSASDRIGVLTPGPANETYFEHAYLARYLGFLLLEGGDLVVHGNTVNVRTVDGFQPLSVLWRRMDADFADPLELFQRSRIGTPGLVRAIRAERVNMVNALGSGILETRALLAFQPALAKALIGEDLLLPTIATWWCGQASERGYVSKNRETLSLASAFPAASGSNITAAPLDLGINRDASERFLAELEAGGTGLVGQEVVTLSTAPVFIDDRLEARPVTMRVFLARDEAGWHVMPGGFARISDAVDAKAVSMQAGGRSADVWITSDRDVAPITLIGPRPSQILRRLPAGLPARAADNLFWLGRYAERAEVATRLLRLHVARQSEGTRHDLLERRVAKVLRSLGIHVDAAHPAAGLLHLVRSAFDIASRIRDRFSPDGWRTLSEIVAMLEAREAHDDDVDLIALTSDVLTRLSGFTGLVRENMYQFVGWRFLTCGRRIERGLMTASIASAITADETPEGAFDALLEFTDSRVTYRRRYPVALSRETVLDLTVLDPLNPRSIAYQVTALKDAMDALPGMVPGEQLDEMARRVARLGVRVATGSAAEVTTAFLDRIAGDFSDLSELLGQRYFAARPEEAVDWFEHE